MVKELRKKYGLTRKALGELMGVTITTIYRWETGDRNPSKTAQILLSVIEKGLERKRLAKRRIRKEVKKHGKRHLQKR